MAIIKNKISDHSFTAVSEQITAVSSPTHPTPRKWLIASIALTILINTIGATLTYTYFAFVESGLTRPTEGNRLDASPVLFVVVMIILMVGVVALHLKLLRPTYGASWHKLEEMPDDAREILKARLMNEPLMAAGISLLGWLSAAIFYACVSAFYLSATADGWHEGLRIFVGNIMVGAPFTVVSLYFVLEWLLRKKIPEVFPAGLAATIPHSIRINVLPKMLVVSLMIGTIPVSIISYITLSQIHAVEAGRQSITSFLSQMPGVIGFLLGLAVVVAAGLSVFVAHSISCPLTDLRVAMDRIRQGDLDVRIPVLLNDEIGNVSDGFNRMVAGLRERDFIRDTFGSYLSPHVVAEILASPQGMNLSGELREVTVLVSDLRGFTPLVAAVDPAIVVRILNLYLERMVRIILRHQGTIDEFTGDGILAFFGAPHRIADSQWQAIRCAMEMRRAMPELNEDLMRTIPDLGQLPLSIRPPDRTPGTSSPVLPLKMGIAINCGNLIVGNIGCEERKKYGAVGTPINMAFRMEKKAGPGEIIISPGVHSRIAGRVQTVSVPEVALAGFPEPVTLFKVMGESL